MAENRGVRRLIVLVSLLLACTAQPVTTATPSESPTAPGTFTPAPTASPTQSGRAVALHGATFAMPVDDHAEQFFADRGSLVALASKQGPPPYASKVLIAYPALGPWREVYATDARFNSPVLANGFLALLEYREQGAGAYTERLVVVDLPSGRPQVVDSYALSAATFRGGGGGPPRPAGAMMLGGGLVAWVRLVEGSGGSTTGELRVSLPNQPAQAKLVATSDTSIRPISVDVFSLVYRITRGFTTEIRVRDLASGAERVLATRAVRDITNVSAGLPFDRAARSAAWVGWVEDPQSGTPTPTESTLHAVNIANGATRELSLGNSYCPMITGNDRFFALNCSGARPSVVLVDTISWTALPTATSVSSGPFLLQASDMSELLWQDRLAGSRRVVLFTPTTDPRTLSPAPSLVPQVNATLGYRLGLPSRYRLAASSGPGDGSGQDYYSPRTPEEDRALCQSEGAIPSPERAFDLRVIVSAPGPTSAVEFASAPQRHVIFTTLEELTIDGHDAVRVVGLPSGQGAEYIIHANDRIYEITPPFGSTSTEPGQFGWLDQIALSFAAIAPQPMPGSLPSFRGICGS